MKALGRVHRPTGEVILLDFVLGNHTVLGTAGKDKWQPEAATKH